MDLIGTNGKAPEGENELAYFRSQGLPIKLLSDLHIVRVSHTNKCNPCNPCVPLRRDPCQKTLNFLRDYKVAGTVARPTLSFIVRAR
jgi:hypothetical protein